MNADAFSLLLAVVPIGLYFGSIAVIRITGRCLILTSTREWFAMAIAAAGLIAVGPAQLFFPGTAAAVFGPRVWLAIALLYGLVVLLITLVIRPSLAVYGRTAEEIYPVLLEAGRAMDPDATGQPASLSVNLPAIGVRLRCDGDPKNDAARIVSFTPAYGPSFWTGLAADIRQRVPPIDRNKRSAKGWVALIGSVAAIVGAVGYGWVSAEEVSEEMTRWLRR